MESHSSNWLPSFSGKKRSLFHSKTHTFSELPYFHKQRPGSYQSNQMNLTRQGQVRLTRFLLLGSLHSMAIVKPFNNMPIAYRCCKKFRFLFGYLCWLKTTIRTFKSPRILIYPQICDRNKFYITFLNVSVYGYRATSHRNLWIEISYPHIIWHYINL